MAVKLILALIVVLVIISIAVAASFWYFKETAEMKHERELKQMEQTEALFEDEDPIDRELEREENR